MNMNTDRWMSCIDSSVRQWAVTGWSTTSMELVYVRAEVENAWHDGAPTKKVLDYTNQRIAFYKKDMHGVC